MVHSADSARLHLAQVAACLRNICFEASPASLALSLQHYPTHLLAGDNANPSPLLDDVFDLERERLEHQLERMAAKYPSNIALDFRETIQAAPGDESAGNYLYNYKELDRRARIISSHLHKHLMQADETHARGAPIVALCLEKSRFTYLAILAVLKAGAAWCPIDTDWPRARRQALLAKSGAQVILTAGEQVCNQIPPSHMSIIRLDTLDYSRSAPSTSARRQPSSDDLAYLIWTSGTTGLPKAVGVQHKAAVQALRSLQRVIPHSDTDFQYLQYSAYNFDLMILDVFYTWGLGGTLCSGSRSLLLSQLIELSNAFRATHTLLTPAVLAMMPRESIPSLQVVINGGEKLSQVVADTWSVDCCLLNLYGPAEATLIAMSRTVPRGDAIKAPNIGRALPTTSCHAINQDGDVVLKGAVGQLVLGGHQCAMGYVGDEERTREQFVDHLQLGRVYLTGDLVRQLWSGEYEYLGRNDDQIKVNGIRIELLEINNVIRDATKQVKDTETLVIRKGQPEKEGIDVQLVNFSVVPLAGSSETLATIRTDEEATQVAQHLARFAASNLPSYMTPSLFVIVSRFPRTSSAKIDREALRHELEHLDTLHWLNKLADTTAKSVSDEKLGSQEAIIRSQLASLCGIAENAFGRHTTFPSLGLNSIKAITLSHRLMQAGISATVVDLIQCQTLASLAERVSGDASTKNDRAHKIAAFLYDFDRLYRRDISLHLQQAGSSSEIQAVLPVTSLQEALLSETSRDKSRYWLHRAYSLPPSSDIARLQQAIQAVVERVDILRTCFVHTSQLLPAEAAPHHSTETAAASRTPTFIQVVQSRCCVKSTVIVESAKAKAWDDSILEHLDSNFALTASGTQPPVAFLIAKGGKQIQLVLVLHHALYDQVTLGMIEDAIVMCYQNGLKAKCQMQSFSSALHHLISCDDDEERQRYDAWMRLLSKYPKGHAVSFPNLSGFDGVSSTSSTSKYGRKTNITMVKTEEVAKKWQVSIRPILQAAWAAVMCAHCDTSDLILGDSISARTMSKQLDYVAGPLLDTLAVPICIEATYRSISTAIDDFHKKAIVNLPVPLRQIRDMVAMPNEIPLFASVFVFDPPGSKGTRLETKEGLLQQYRDFSLSVEHSVAVEVTVTEDGLFELGLVVKDAVVSPDYAHTILTQWECAIQQAMMQPDSFASDFDAAFFSQDVLSISRCKMPGSLKLAHKKPVFAALTGWAADTPDAVAVEFYPSLNQRTSGKVTKTYRELEEESTRLSHVLRDRIQTTSVVAVCLHRSAELYVFLLAIFKAGMTYLPVDPSLPAKRKNDLLKHSQAALVVWSALTEWALESEGDMKGVEAFDSASMLAAAPASVHSPLPLDMSSSAYIIFTSGSTGTPKGCVLTHSNLSSAIEAFRLTYEEMAPNTLDNTTRFLARSVEAFDVALLEALLPLQVGGSIVTGPRNVILQDLALAMQVMQVTHAAVVPSLLHTRGRKIIPADLPLLRALVVGGERVTRDIITTWTCSHVPLLNAYGPSEACIGTSIARLSMQDSTSNIGAPFVGTQYFVMKTTKRGFRLALRGEAGELCIGGLQVGSYLGVGKSASFMQWKGQRLYRTGDEVRLRRDDIAEYLGRSSIGQGGNQVKVLGVRIELGEVDSVLTRESKVTRFCLTRVLGNCRHLVTFISVFASSLREGEVLHTVGAEEPLQEEARRLHEVAREKLPSYMVPRHVIPMAIIPLSSISGKMDGKRLDEWYQSHASELLLQSSIDSSQDSQRGLTLTETVVKEEILRLLAADAYLGPLTNVFSLGLDSLDVISLSHALGKRDIHADVAHIMAHPTIEAIARASTAQSSGHFEEQLDYTRQVQQANSVDVIRAYPLLPLQESMITQTLSNDAERAWPYINMIKLKCRADSINRERLQHSMEETLCSHQIYRTIFVEMGERRVQAVLRDRPTWRLDEADFDVIAAHQISTTLHRVPPLRYCITPSNSILLAIHHALYDGESLADLLEEVEARYMGRSIAKAGDFVHYVEDMSVRSTEDKLSAWKEVLGDAVVAPFPCLTGEKMPTRDVRERLSVEHRPKISLSLLKERARQEHVTVQLLVVDAFARLYSRYVGQDKILFGLVLGGRTSRSSAAKMHGPCLNTVPFYYQADSKDGWKQLQSMYAIALANQHVSLPELARLLQVQSGLFNTLFSYLGTIRTSSFLEETSSSLLTEYPFAVEVQEMPQSDQVELRAVFHPHYIPAEQAELFLRQLEEILSTSSSSSSAPTCQLFAIENENPVVPSPDASFLARFNHQVQLQPDAVAYAFSHNFTLPNEETSYRQLDDFSSAMATKLSSIKGSVVGVLLKQCPALYPLLLAIWKVAKVYLPLDPSLPPDRLAYMVSVAKPACIVSAKENLAMADQLGQTVCIDDLQRTHTSSSRRETEPDLGKPAYIMFTSGSSGNPKGVQVSHMALAAAIYSWSQILPYTCSSRMLQLASPGFDVFFIEVCMPLALGFSFASAAKEDLLNDLQLTFDKLQLTMADLPAVLAGAVQPSKIKNQQPLQWLMSGGDVIEDRVIRQWSKHGLINAWGPTETTIGNTLGFVGEMSSRNWVGKAYPTSSIYILDSSGTAITYRGCIGEIAVGGPQVADGYVGNKDLTREKFVMLADGKRVYRTGDRGRLLFDGSLECLGRLDSGQVKINSQRVELREIEVQLKRHGDVLDAVVLYLEHSEMPSKQLVAFFVVKGGTCNSCKVEFRHDERAKQVVAACLEQARHRLASYMIPSLCLIVAASRLPLTPNNKVDTKHIQAVYSGMTAKEIRQLDAQSQQGEVQREWTEQESRLRTIVAGFCKVDEGEVGRDAPFHRLGIDSISGFRLLKRLRQHGYTKMALRDILQSPTVALLAKSIDERADQQQNGAGDAVEQLDMLWRSRCNATSFCLNQDDEIKRLLPCTPLQEGLLLESLNSGLYLHHHFFRIDEDALPLVMEAVMATARSHDILRTSFHLINDHFVQAVHTYNPLQIPPVIETPNMKRAVMAITNSKHCTEEADLAKPLFSVSLLRSAEEGLFVVALCLHHALYDGETLAMLFQEIAARASGHAVTPRLHFEHLLPHLLSREKDERFIVDQVWDCRSTLLDPNGPTLSSLARSCHSSERRLDIGVEALGQFASHTGVSLHMVALFAFVKMLSHLTGQRDVVFAQLFSLRDAIPGAEHIIGPALNSVLTRASLLDGETAQMTLARMQADHDATREHRRASMAQVLRMARKDRGGRPIGFDSLFDFQAGRNEDVKGGKERTMVPWEVEEEDAISQYTLNVQFRQEGNLLSVVAVGDSSIFTANALGQHLETLEETLRLVLADGSRSSTTMPSKVSDVVPLPFTSGKGSIGPASSTVLSAKTTVHVSSREQELVLAVVSEVLQMDKEDVDSTTPINQLGIDSIMAIQLASRLRAKGLGVGVADVLQGKTIEGIIQRIAEKTIKGRKVVQSTNEYGVEELVDGKEEAARLLGILPREIKAVLPLLPGQVFELAEYIQSKGRSGIFTFVYKINEETIDEVRMEEAWKQVCTNHAILRTCFAMCSGKARQVVLTSDQADPSWQSCRFQGSISSMLSDSLTRITWPKEACKIDANLTRPPRAACLVSASDGCFLVLRLHHILYDASTIKILLQDLWRLYSQDENKGMERPKDDYIGLVRHLSSEERVLSGDAEAYWKGLLSDVSSCIVGKAVLHFAAPSMTTLCMPAIVEEAAKIETQIRHSGASLGTAFTAAWSRCLLDLFPSHDKIVFGLYHRGRSCDYAGVDTVAYNGMNVLPLVVGRWSARFSADLLASIQGQLDNQIEYESTTSMMDILAVTKSKTVIWNTYLNLVWDDKVQRQDDLTQHLDPVALPECEREEVAGDGMSWHGMSSWEMANIGDMRCDVNVNLSWDRKRDCINAAVRYRSDLLSSKEAEQMSTAMVKHFNALVLSLSRHT